MIFIFDGSESFFLELVAIFNIQELSKTNKIVYSINGKISADPSISKVRNTCVFVETKKENNMDDSHQSDKKMHANWLRCAVQLLSVYLLPVCTPCICI